MKYKESKKQISGHHLKKRHLRLAVAEIQVGEANRQASIANADTARMTERALRGEALDDLVPDFLSLIR